MFESTPFPPIVFYAHLGLGALGLACALIAFSATKGGVAHIRAGRTMVACMAISSITALIFMLIKFSVPPVINSVTALYGLAAAVLALQKFTPLVRRLEYLASAILLVTFVWFLSQAIPGVINGNVPVVGPITVGLVAVIFLIGDIHYFRNLHKRQQLRIRRHATRIIWAFVVLIRAPLFELREELSLPLPLVLIAPLLLGLVLQITFWNTAKRLGGSRS